MPGNRQSRRFRDCPDDPEKRQKSVDVSAMALSFALALAVRIGEKSWNTTASPPTGDGSAREIHCTHRATLAEAAPGEGEPSQVRTNDGRRGLVPRTLMVRSHPNAPVCLPRLCPACLSLRVGTEGDHC